MTKVRGGAVMLSSGMKRESKIRLFMAFFGHTRKQAEEELDRTGA